MRHQHHHHYRQNRPFGAIAFLRRLHPVSTSLDFGGIISIEQGHQPCVQPQPGGPGPYIFIPQWKRGPYIPPGTRFPFRQLRIFTPVNTTVSYKIYE
jgi:hypothetical protein